MLVYVGRNDSRRPARTREELPKLYLSSQSSFAADCPCEAGRVPHDRNRSRTLLYATLRVQGGLVLVRLLRTRFRGARRHQLRAKFPAHVCERLQWQQNHSFEATYIGLLQQGLLSAVTTTLTACRHGSAVLVLLLGHET